MTHNQRVLQLLSDGKPHTHHELYALHVVAHSRVSDLRKQGYRIEQWRDRDTYLYRLLDPAATLTGGAAGSSGAGMAGGSPPPWEQPAAGSLADAASHDAAPLEPIPGQLTLEAA